MKNQREEPLPEITPLNPQAIEDLKKLRKEFEDMRKKQEEREQQIKNTGNEAIQNEINKLREEIKKLKNLQTEPITSITIADTVKQIVNEKIPYIKDSVHEELQEEI